MKPKLADLLAAAAPRARRGRPPDVAVHPQLLEAPGAYVHPEVRRRFSWTPPPADRDGVREAGLHAMFERVTGTPDPLALRVAGEMADGLYTVLPGLTRPLRGWTLRFDPRVGLTAWTKPTSRTLEVAGHPLSASLLVHEATHVADAQAYAGNGACMMGSDQWGCRDPEHPLGRFTEELRTVWKQSGAQDALVESHVRRGAAQLPLALARRLVRGDGVPRAEALATVAARVGVAIDPGAADEAWEDTLSMPFGGSMDAFLARTGLPRESVPALLALRAFSPTGGVPFTVLLLPEAQRRAWARTLARKHAERAIANYWNLRHEQLARYVDQAVRRDLLRRGRWAPPMIAGGALPEAALDRLEPSGRRLFAEMGWTQR